MIPAPAGRKPAPPSGDLRRLAVRADARGLCVSFTTGSPVEPGTELSFVAHGPFVVQPGGAQVSSGYGFTGMVEEDSVELTYGLAEGPGSQPNRVKGTVQRAGSTVTVRIARAELDRDPANMPNRPPFPYRRFTFEASVITPEGPGGAQEVDFLPAERRGPLGITNGRICRAPCRTGMPK